MRSAVEILQTYWGFDSFRSSQAEIIENVSQNNDVVALLPTGSGKSICFQVPTLQLDKGVCIVVSPLIALMNDQVENLQRKGIKAIALTGSIAQNDLIRIFDNIQFGAIRFLYIAPERLQSPFFQEKIKQLPVSLIAIDEAHCISEWGHDFRPSYLNLHILRELHPSVNCIALTATATERVVNDISKYLQLKNEKIFRNSLIRDNLQLSVHESADKLGSLLYYIKPNDEPIIVYAGTRNNCQQTSVFLNNNGIKSVYYHAGLTKQAKDKAYKDWYNEKAQVMVATNAFGMGIDKSNVRKVIHTSLPYSIENYIQEAGRAGRDNKKAFAIVIEELEHIEDKYAYYTESLPTPDFIKILYDKLNQYFKISYGSLSEQVFSYKLADFCKQYNLPVLQTYNGLEFLEREGIVKLISVNQSKNELVFTANNNQLYAYYNENPTKEKILKNILRTYDGIIDSFRTIDIYDLGVKLSLSVSEIETQLKQIHNDGFIIFHKGNNDAGIQFLQAREDQYTINTIIPNLKIQKRIKLEKYNSILNYVTNKSTCRNRLIRNYFGEKSDKDCGICDVCLDKNKAKNTNSKQIRINIVELLKKQPLSSKELVIKLELNSEVVLKALQFLLDTNVIIVTSHNKYRLNES